MIRIHERTRFRYTFLMRLPKAVIIVGLLLVPSFACARQAVTWDFTNGNVPGNWDIRGWSAAPTPEADGLHIVTSKDGGMLRTLDAGFGVDMVRVTFARGGNFQASFIWNVPNDSQDTIYQLPFMAEESRPDVQLDLGSAQGWTRFATRVGLYLPAGTDIFLKSIELSGGTPAEKIFNGWKSFWTFEYFGNTSINFLWGPILRFTPLYTTVFDSNPPQGWSVNRVFYALLILAAIALAIAVIIKKYSMRRATQLFFIITFGLWIFYDLRMGLQFLSFVKSDEQYVTGATDQFRVYENFYAALKKSVPSLQKYPTYVFLYPKGSSVASRVAYFAYPSRPVAENDDTTGVKTWFVFRRPDVTIDADGRLIRNGGSKVFAIGGKIIKQFDATSFLYQIP